MPQIEKSARRIGVHAINQIHSCFKLTVQIFSVFNDKDPSLLTSFLEVRKPVNTSMTEKKNLLEVQPN